MGTAPETSQLSRKRGLVLRRFLTPSIVVSAYGYLKLGAMISPRAEVELSPFLQLGRGTRVSSFTKIKATDGPLVTGEKCGFGTCCFIDSGSAGIRMGDYVICGPSVSIIATNYRYANVGSLFEEQGHSSKGILIGRNVWIGANSVVLDGSVIGDNSIIVANSLVNRRFPPNVIIQGNPAKVIFTRHGSEGADVSA
jgi:acetyltransferase-like isoleucine patch superfamily enzyme